MLTISLFMTKLSLNLPKGDTFTLCNACRIDAEPQKRANEMKVTRVLNFYSEAILPYSRILSLFFFTPHQDVRCYGCIMRFSSFFKSLSDGNSSIQFWLLEFVVLQNFAFQFIHLSTYYLNTGIPRLVRFQLVRFSIQCGLQTALNSAIFRFSAVFFQKNC